ncbi:MAG TPA: HAD hydrolase family protein [Anaerolineales bacterium]|nr:HAD hydrolase family protein [Anaerolineales bacterium]
MAPIRLLLLDIDGVLTQGEAKALDLALLARLAEMNRAARADPTRPAVSLCTGRPAPYVEVMMQAIDGHLPAVFENGCGLYAPREYRFLPHPRLGDGRAFADARERLRALARSGQVFFQPGKEYSLSLFPLDGVAVADLYPLAESALEAARASVDLVYSSSCLNVLPRGVNKGEGLRFLCEVAGFQLDEVLGVGDSDVDLQFLALAGRSAAPANAADEVKRIVSYVSPRDTSEGVRDILRHFGLPL